MKWSRSEFRASTILFWRMVVGLQRLILYGRKMTLETLEKFLPRDRISGFPTRTPTKRPSGVLWPHGEFSYGYTSPRPDGGEWHEDPYVGLGVDDVAMAGRAGQSPDPLDLSDAPNSHNAAPRGMKGITAYGQQMIKACGFLMGEKFPQHRKTLGTVTLPPMSQSERSAVVEAWPEVTRQLLQWVSRRLERVGLPQLICSVTEVQPKRLLGQSEGYLHWHLLWLNQPAKSGNWAIDPNDLRAFLTGLLERVLSNSTVGYVNVDVRRVKGEAARYLAKYMSKGKQQIAEAMADWGEGVCPRTWWNMTKPARDAVKAATFRGLSVGAALESLVEYGWATSPDEVFSFLRHVEIEFDGVPITVGWRGRLLDPLRVDLTAMLSCS